MVDVGPLDLVGTIRKETHEGGYSIWMLVAHAFVERSSKLSMRSAWLCVYSTAVGNCGEYLPITHDMSNFPIIGYAPGTPAHDDMFVTVEFSPYPPSDDSYMFDINDKVHDAVLNIENEGHIFRGDN